MSGGKHLSAGSTEPPLTKNKLRLYSMRFCPYAQRVHLVLDAKNIPYDVVYIDLTEKPEWYLEKNPLGKVPCLELPDGEILYESMIVAEYLDEAYPNHKLFPVNSLQKAKDKLVIEQANGFITSMYKVLFSAEKEELFTKILECLEIFNRELIKRETPFFGGSRPGMVDLMIWPWCERVDMVKLVCGDQFIIPEDKFLRLSEWKKVMKEDSAVKVSYLTPEIHAKYVKSRATGTPQYDLLASM